MNNTAVFCSSKIDGGGEQSAATIARYLNADLISLSDNSWKEASHKKQVWYMNDKVYMLKEAERAAWTKVMSRAEEVYIVLNFALGGLHTQPWLQYYPIKGILFLNETKRMEWVKKVCPELSGIITRSLAPCVEIEPYLNLNKTPSRTVRIGRHSRISLKYPLPPSGPCEVYDLLLEFYHARPKFSFKFMLAHKDIVAKYQDNDRFKFYSWNEVSIKDFLSQTDIFLYLISQKCNDQGPRVIVEAMAAGIPCIAENRDGMKDRITNGVNGFLVESTEEAVKMTNLLIRDKIVRETLGANAREFARQNFNPTNWVKALGGE